MEKKKVGIWIRVSTEEQASGDSPEHHEKRAQMYAEVKGWEVSEVYLLLGVSGKSVINHPEAAKMLRDIQSKKITGLIFSKLARLSRDVRQLNDFAEAFKEYDADLISLDEAIDTSTPAGRLFYNIIASMAQWEREEIADRVAKSVEVRAKLGKQIGGEAPFGYRWINKKLELDKKEAPVRKLMYELFIKEKRKLKVAKLLNEKGYRTRKGGTFSDTTVDRLLKDPIAKGLRRTNYTREKKDGSTWEYKPKDEWIFAEAPRIISDEMWQQCQDIMNEVSGGRKKIRRNSVHLFTNVLHCECGGKMYMRPQSPRYVCKVCKNKISPEDLEFIYQSQLKQIVFSEDEIKKQLASEQKELDDKKQLLQTLESDIQGLKKRIQDTMELYHAGELTKDTFKDYYRPLQEQLDQKETELETTQSNIDQLAIHTLSNKQVIHEAQSLHSLWPDLSNKDKKLIIEAITVKIIVGDQDMAITFNYLPALSDKENSSSFRIHETIQRSHIGAWYQDDLLPMAFSLINQEWQVF